MLTDLASRIRKANTALLVEWNFDAISDYFAYDYIIHLTDNDIIGDHGTVRRILTMLQRAFPRLTVEVEILVEGTDRIAWQRTLRGQHEGDYKGFPSTGKTLVWRDMITSRFDGNHRIVEDWFITDLAEQLLLARKK